MKIKTELEKNLQHAYALAYRLLGEDADAHDVIQDAAAIAIRHERSSTTPTNSEDFRAWFFKVVRNKSIDLLRQKKRYQDKEESFEEIEVEAINTGPERLLDIAQQQEKVTEALNKINFKYREIILLKDFHNFSYADVASILGIAKGSVMSRLHRARQAFSNQLFNLK